MFVFPEENRSEQNDLTNKFEKLQEFIKELSQRLCDVGVPNQAQYQDLESLTLA